MKNFRQYILLFLRGIAMGAVDLVPGVSAGTIALVTGIYAELIHCIKSFNMQAIRMLKADGLGATWQYINGSFLVAVVAGMLVSLFSLAGVMRFLLNTYPLQLWSFFTGLIIASVLYLLRQHPPKRPFEIGVFCIGLICAYAISIAPSMVMEDNYISVFFAGSIALCAMILPGISGSFILVLLGLYPLFIDALVNIQIDFLVIFAAGGVLGLMLFSRLLSWLLDHYKNAVIATMCGFLVGSLNVIWPWKLVTSSMLDHAGKTIVLSAENLSPQNFSVIVGQDPQTIFCIMALLVGFFLVLGVEFLGSRYQKKMR